MKVTGEMEDAFWKALDGSDYRVGAIRGALQVVLDLIHADLPVKITISKNGLEAIFLPPVTFDIEPHSIVGILEMGITVERAE